MITASSLSGKLALITGASRGIGRALAMRLINAGAHVIALARTQGGLIELDDYARTQNKHVTLVPLDLRRTEDFTPLAETIRTRAGHLDILVLNAAVMGENTRVADFTAKVWHDTMAVNAVSQLRLLGALDGLLRAAPSAQVIGMMDHEMCGAYFGAYAASKSALREGLKSYAAEVQQTNITVKEFAPSPTATALRKAAFPGENAQQLATPDFAAELLIEKLAS
ncbi:MAG TPA: SDR family NAD(P)-dependent oxidoreductase [Alphaproteobacteria bacterium]|nr:oxidoreductase [Rhodospirillaceae bacterium]HRJ11633.1 SDR family NAD(P)-dependent oxidoreductase [Alphaproteobacteria bacterium]